MAAWLGVRTKVKAVILHGKGSDHTSNWYGWVADELRKKGWEVWVPDLPGWNQPSAQAGIDYLLSQKWDWHDSVVIGHSAGSVLILPLLEKLQVKIKLAILVATFTKELSKDPEWTELSGLFTEPFDFEKIKNHAVKFLVIHSDDDPICPVSQAKEVSQNLDAKFILIPNAQHFSVTRSGPRFEKSPEILEIISQEVLQ